MKNTCTFFGHRDAPYVRKTRGGAYKFKTLAEKQNKTVINLYKEEKNPTETVNLCG